MKNFLLILSIFVFLSGCDLISDLFDIYSIIQHNNEFRNYSCLLNIYNTHWYLKQMNVTKLKPFIYNKYISRSLIQSHSQKLNYTYTNQYKSVIHLYLFSLFKNINKSFFNQRFKKIHKKELEYYIKSFNYIYGSKIKIQEIYNS